MSESSRSCQESGKSAAVENRRSRAIPERLGFHQEGTLREAEVVDGRTLDSVMSSMLKADWREQALSAAARP